MKKVSRERTKTHSITTAAPLFLLSTVRTAAAVGIATHISIE